MDLQKRTLQVGAAAIACALVLRLAPVAAEGTMKLLESGQTASLLLYLETGHILKAPSGALTDSQSTEPAATIPETTAATTPTPMLPVFRPEDVQLVEMRYHANYKPDIEELLCKPLDWDLTAESPSVLILHTHTTESYTKTNEDIYKETSDYRTLDENFNMISLGAYLAQLLEEGGIGVIHSRTLHDYPSYSGSYVNSRETAKELLEQYPTIKLVLDLHRDAIDDGSGNQLGTTVQAEGKTTAQLMMVVGTDAGNRNHPDWQENLSLALKLHVALQKRYPGLCRDISFRTQRFNQDLSPGALLIEVGAAGNTRAEALAAVEALARGIIDLAHGSQ